jgi:hypothetical protein
MHLLHVYYAYADVKSRFGSLGAWIKYFKMYLPPKPKVSHITNQPLF